MNSAQNMPPTPPMLGFPESIVRCFRKYATFRGRATRAEYWWFSLFNTLLGTAVYAAVQHLMGTESADEVISFVQLAIFLPMLAVGVRRLHDIDFRGWWMLLGLTGVGIIPLIIFFCLPGKAAPNRFGVREYGAQAAPVTQPAPVARTAPVPQPEPVAQQGPVTQTTPETQGVPTTPQPEAVNQTAPVPQTGPAMQAAPEQQAAPAAQPVPETQAAPVSQTAAVTEAAPEQPVVPAAQPEAAAQTTPTTQPEAVVQPDTEKPVEKGGTRLMSALLCLFCLAGLSLAAPSAGIASDTDQPASVASNPDTPKATSGSPATSDAPAAPSSPASGQGMEQGIQEAFGGIISIMGEALGGMTKGMQEGARDIQAQLDGSDGTRVISNSKDLAALTEPRVLKAEQLEDRSWRITLAVRNPQEFPVRLAGLTDKRQVLLLDQEEFVHEPASAGERLVTVPERAAQKLVFLFPELDGSTPRTLRLYGMDIAVPQAAGTGNVSP